jgi:hypothetical protein
VHRTLQLASEAGNLFSFVPEIYLNDIYVNTFTALNVYYPLEGKSKPSNEWTNVCTLMCFIDSVSSRETATDFVQFVANHMQDPRIVNTGTVFLLQ